MFVCFSHCCVLNRGLSEFQAIPSTANLMSIVCNWQKAECLFTHTHTPPHTHTNTHNKMIRILDKILKKSIVYSYFKNSSHFLANENIVLLCKDVVLWYSGTCLKSQSFDLNDLYFKVIIIYIRKWRWDWSSWDSISNNVGKYICNHNQTQRDQVRLSFIIYQN